MSLQIIGRRNGKIIVETQDSIFVAVPKTDANRALSLEEYRELVYGYLELKRMDPNQLKKELFFKYPEHLHNLIDEAPEHATPESMGVDELGFGVAGLGLARSRSSDSDSEVCVDNHIENYDQAMSHYLGPVESRRTLGRKALALGAVGLGILGLGAIGERTANASHVQHECNCGGGSIYHGYCSDSWATCCGMLGCCIVSGHCHHRYQDWYTGYPLPCYYCVTHDFGLYCGC